MGLRKTSASLHTRLATEMHPAGELWQQVAVNRDEFLKLRGKTRMPLLFKRDEIHNNNNNNNETSEAKQEGIQHTRARLGEVLKNK